jgi:anti-sigma regulatory factor (Ser/Thr protein kinase)
VFYSTALPKSPTSASQARRFLDQVIDDLTPDRLEDARLLVSELVANAVEHVAEDGEIELRLDLTDGRLRVEVEDPGPGFVVQERPVDSDRGWGLHFVRLLASDWGVEQGERSRVWFELLTGR